jgi:hypothetical protein
VLDSRLCSCVFDLFVHVTSTFAVLTTGQSRAARYGGGDSSMPPVEWTTSVAVGYGWWCDYCSILNAPADLGCRECYAPRTEDPPPFISPTGKVDEVLLIPQKSIGSLLGKSGSKIRIVRELFHHSSLCVCVCVCVCVCLLKRVTHT